MTAITWTKGARRACLVALLLAATLACAVLSGCGLQTEEANKALAAAMQHQSQAEQALGRIKNFPSEWSAIFTNPVNATKVAQGQQLVAARETDAATIDSELKICEQQLRPILKLNVDEKIKQFVKLKLLAIADYRDYAANYLTPMLKSYEGLLQKIAYGRPLAEVNQAASEITTMAAEAQTKLEKAIAASQKADDYFNNNKLGK